MSPRSKFALLSPVVAVIIGSTLAEDVPLATTVSAGFSVDSESAHRIPALQSSSSGLFAHDGTALNGTFLEERRLTASEGCQTCCGTGDCDQAFKNEDAGMCCDKSHVLCCPKYHEGAAVQCAQNGCMKASTPQTTVTHVTRTTHTHGYGYGYGYYGYRRHSSSPISSFIAIALIILLICCCLAAAKNNGPGHSRPVGGYDGTDGGDVALGAGGGFLAGLGLGALMAGPSYGPGWGYGGYGYGGGWGDGYGGFDSTTVTTETYTTTTGGGGDGGFFAGDGGGGGGGDFGFDGGDGDGGDGDGD